MLEQFREANEELDGEYNAFKSMLEIRKYGIHLVLPYFKYWCYFQLASIFVIEEKMWGRGSVYD